MIETDSIYSDEYSRKKFVDAVVKALKSDEVIDTKEAQQYDWSKVAKQWKEAIDA